VSIVYRKLTVRLSKKVCVNAESTKAFEWPTQAMVEQWNGVLHYLIGFENNQQDGTSKFFNPILSNGDRSHQRDACVKQYYTHMMPEGSQDKIRSVTIHFYGNIYGFSFFDKDRKLLWKIGYTKSLYTVINSGDKVETVLIAENEVIVGVKARLFPGCQSVYTDFQFQIGSRLK
jgi:hypothetical protein